MEEAQWTSSQEIHVNVYSTKSYMIKISLRYNLVVRF